MPQALHTRIRALLRHPDRPRIWLQPAGSGWDLPAADHPHRLFVADVGGVNAALGERLGCEVWTLRQVWRAEDEDAGRTDCLYEVESCDRDAALPTAGRWVGAGDLADLDLAPELPAAAVVGYLSSLERGEVPKLRPPWARPGWRREVRAWIEARLADRGRRLRALRQAKQWGVSSVLCAATDDGDVWFKTTNTAMPLFVNEAAVTTRLHALFPSHVPAPLAVDVDRDWMLLAAFDEILDDADVDTRRRVHAGFAHLQVAAAGRVDELLAAGCLDRRPAVLAAQVAPLLDDPQATARLAPDERAQLASLRDPLQALCAELADDGLPDTLVHGDLHEGNTARVDGRLVTFDWTDACVAHPFLDLQALAWIEDEAVRETLIDAYLQPWTQVRPLAELRRAWRRAHALLPLHHAVSYQHIVAALEPDSRGELDDTHVFLRQLLARVPAYLASTS